MADLPATPKLKVVTTPGGAKFSVAEEYAPRFQAFVNELAKTYNIDPATSGGYNQRYIAGTQTPSEHAYGRAIDVDWNENPQGGKSFKIDPTTARTLASKYGLTWGGDWQGSTADPMHFQVNQGVAWDPQNGAVPNTQYASSANAINTVASPALTTSPGSATPASTNANNVTPATPAANQNTNAPAVTPTSSDIATAFQTHLAALQQQNANLQLQQNMVNQRQKQLAFGLAGDPTATFFGQASKALSGIV